MDMQRHRDPPGVIPFNFPYMTGKELFYIAEAHFNGRLSGDGPFTGKCQQWLEQNLGTGRALLTNSCTAALEMAAILMDIGEGDEVIMPSYTFVSTANAFVLRGAVPVFVDIREDTKNIDERKIEEAITARTRAIVVVHYAGVACEMDAILDIARRHDLVLIEDAAQGIMSSYKGRSLGAIGDMGALSFHETKNVISGEGGSLLVNNSRYGLRAEIVREKGTNRSQFFRGEVDKYTWCDIGSSFLPGELVSSFLWAQLQDAREITRRRLALWDRYHEAFEACERNGQICRPVVPEGCIHNAHMYYLLLPDLESRTYFISKLKESGIYTVFHYVPLHLSPKGREVARVCGGMDVTEHVADRLVRLPLWLGLEDMQDEVIERVTETIGGM